jgi:hypothetical protein
MRKIKHLLTLFTSMLITLFVQAQAGTGESGFGETMRSNGRIYVVIAVMLTILIGLIIYLVRLDKKISKLEKEI